MDPWLTCSAYRLELLRLDLLQLQNMFEHTLPMRKPRLPKSLRSLNSAFVVCKKKLVLQKLDESCPSGTFHDWKVLKERLNRWHVETLHRVVADVFLQNSDGIARVHGLNNVQAEELVEYVPF